MMQVEKEKKKKPVSPSFIVKIPLKPDYEQSDKCAIALLTLAIIP